MESTNSTSDSGLTAEGASRTFVDSDLNTLFMECAPLAAKWKEVSLCLGLEKTHIDTIAADSKSVTNSLIEALTMWVRQNYSTKEFGLPSWSTLVKAVARVDRRLAEELATKHQCSLEELTPETPPATDENKPSPDQVTKPPAAAAEGTPMEKSQPRSETGVEMIRSNEHEIDALFATLLLAVQAALGVSNDVTRVRDFLIAFFKQDFPITENVKDLLQRVTVNNLWSYHNSSPLEKLINHFLAGNEEIATMMSEYKERLTGHYMTTKLIDYMQYRKELFTSESDTESDEEPTDPSPPKLTKKLHKRIKVVLKLERKISNLSLQYVHNLWIAFAKEYDIPSLTAILEKIATGSLEISWLIPASFADRIRPRSRFFRQHRIVTVFIDGDIIYDENQMADKEQKFLRLFVERNTPVPKFLPLLDEGVDPDLYDKYGRHPLWYASHRGRLDLVELFLRYGASVDLATQDEYGETALVTAVDKGHHQIVEVLVRHGADVNYRDKIRALLH